MPCLLCSFDAFISDFSLLFSPCLVAYNSKNLSSSADANKGAELIKSLLSLSEKLYINIGDNSTLDMIKKDLKGISGVYCFIHVASGKLYIGSSVNLLARFNEHLNNRHSNVHLQRAFKKYGFINFNFIVLKYCDKDELIKQEQNYLNQATEKYNICLIAGSTLGRKHSEESKIKIGNASRGRQHSEETKEKLRNRKCNPETIEKFKARRATPETKKKN